MPVVLIPLDEIDSFHEVRAYPSSSIGPALITAVRELNEREELEPFLRSILTDVGDTPHGPAEIVDILTHKLAYRGAPTLSAFILKGRSFPTVRPKDISHQIYRLEKISGLGIAVLGYTGVILDAAKEQFCSTAERLGCRQLVLDAVEIARLFVAYGFLCPRPEDAPRGMEFLYSLNRLNVATSRAQAVCILTSSPLLFEPDCKTPRQMRLANALCRYRELATELVVRLQP